MDRNSVLARVASGFAIRGAAIGAALYAGHAAWLYVASVFAEVSLALPH